MLRNQNTVHALMASGPFDLDEHAFFKSVKRWPVSVGLDFWGDNTTGAVGGGPQANQSPNKAYAISNQKHQSVASSGTTTTTGIVGAAILNGVLYTQGSNLNYGTARGINTGISDWGASTTLIVDWKDLKGCNASNATFIGRRNDNSLYAWGSNTNGKTGQGLTTSSTTSPTAISGMTVTDYDVSTNFCAGIKGDGTLWNWGLRQYIGSGITSGTASTPVQVGTDTDWSKIATGSQHSLAIKASGALYATGIQANGSLGNNVNSSVNLTSWAQIGTDTDWTKVSAGNACSAGLKSGQLWVWGTNTSGQLGLGDTTNRLVPTRVGSASNWVDVFIVETGIIAINSDHELWYSGTPSLTFTDQNILTLTKFYTFNAAPLFGGKASVFGITF